MDKKRVVILGAGPTGLSCAWQLIKHGVAVTVIEKQEEVGGHSKTNTVRGYNVDEGPHKLYPQVPCAKPLIDHFVGGDLLQMSKTSKVYVRGTFMNYPFGIVDLFRALGITTGVLCGLSFIFGKAKSFFRKEDRTYTDFVERHFGGYAHKLIFRSVAEKLWGDADILDVQLAKTRIIAPSVIELLKGMLFGFRGKPKISADAFYYPRKGLRQLWNAMRQEIESLGGILVCDVKLVGIERRQDGVFTVRYRKGQSEDVAAIEAETVVSTIPIKTAYEILNPAPPASVLDAVKSLKLSSLHILYLVINTPRLLEVSWVFFPEARYHFARISEQKSFSEEMVPKDRTVLMVEIPAARETIREKTKNMDRLRDEAVEQLRFVGVLRPEHSILDAFFAYGDSVYPVYDLSYRKNLDQILAYSDSVPGFYLNGRLGLFCYNNMDHSMEMGTFLADHIADGKAITNWQKLRRTFYEYKIVD